VDWYNYFKAKAWALLHDPPNKMWILLNNLRCLEKPQSGAEFSEACVKTLHEKEAETFWEEIGFKKFFGDVAQSSSNSSICELVKNGADPLSASMDRLMLGKIAELLCETGRPIFKYSKLHNIFNPKLSKDLPKKIDCKEVKNYVKAMKNIISNAIEVLSKYDKTEQARTIYHLFYALYELKWIEQGLPPSLAETRMPTHTIFDHNYAAAMTVNMLWPDGNIGGYLVEVDIPSIQRIINSARKAGDFWAGSWLVSMLTWFTVWPLVWKYGPDIVIKPTLRLNPIYHVTLSRKLIELEKSLSDAFLKEIKEFYGNMIFSKVKVGKVSIDEWTLLSNPIIPGTITLLLPAEAAKNEDELKDEIKKQFDNAQQCLTQWALTGSIINECSDLAILLKEVPSGSNKFLQMVERIYNDLKDAKVFDDLIQIRINTVNIGTIHECLQNYLARNTVPEKCVNEGMTENNLKKSKVFLEIIKQLIESEERERRKASKGLREELGRYLTFDLSLAILNTKVQNLSRKSLIIGKPWFIYDATKHIITKPIIDPYSKYVFYKENKGSKTDPPPNIAILKPNEGSVGYIYCSVCGNEPAILHLRRNPGNSNDYNDETKNLLKNLGITNPNDLLTYIKPGEALGPSCIFKRALYYRFRAVYGTPIFDSTDDVAFAWYIKAYGKLGQATQVRGGCERFYNYLNSDGKDITILCGDNPKCTLEKARKEFDECADKVFGNYINEFLNTLTTDIRIMNRYGLDKLRPDPSIIHYRSYYAIIRGDADNIGKLSKGEIYLEDYVSFLEQLKQSSDPVTPIRAYSRLIDIINGLIKEKVGLVVTPTYYAALSMALMITVLRDVFTANFKYYTTPITGLIFSGGDDILALAPTEVVISMVKDLRSNYWGDEDGFHRINNYYIAAPRAYGFGRSFSLRFANIMDTMSEEVREAVELLEDVAKETTWTLNGKELSKDTLVISESRTGKLAVLPLSDPSCNEVSGIPDVLNELFVLRLGGVLSSNVPEDYGRYRDIMEALINNCNKQMMSDVWDYVVENNTKITELKEIVRANLSITTLGQGYKIDPCGKAVIKGGDWSRSTNVINELVKAYEILRGYP